MTGLLISSTVAEEVETQQNPLSLPEESKKSLNDMLLALDYSKAFDSIPDKKVIACLMRMGAPTKLATLIQMLYAEPKCRIKIPEGIREEHSQDIGIRQGCPLSPCSYIIATSCLMLDLLKDWHTEPNHDLPTGATYPALLFADI